MPLKLNMGLSKKVGLPDYGSLGASCHVELELDSALLHNDVDNFHRQVKHAFAACQQAVSDELVRQGQADQDPPSRSSNSVNRAAHRAEAADRAARPAAGGNGQGASEKQLEYLNQLARQIRGLGVRRLETLSSKMYAKPLAGLTSLEASSLIDTLKAIKEGRVSLESALEEAVP